MKSIFALQYLPQLADATNDIGDGDPTNDDTDGDGIPNYLDPDDTASRDD